MPNGIDFVEDTAPAENAIDFQADEEVTPPAGSRILPPNAQFKLTPYQQAAMEGRDTGMFGEGPMAIARGQPGGGGEAIAGAPASFAAAGRGISKAWEATGIPQVGRDLFSDFLVRQGIDPSSTPNPELGKVINLPRLTPEMTRGLPQPLQIGAGVANVVPTFIEGIAQDPALFAATFGAGTLPRVARTLLGTQQFLELPQEVQNAVQVWSDPKSSTAEKTQSLLQPGLSAFFAQQMIKHGWRPKQPEQITGEDLVGRPRGAPLPPQPPPVPTEPVPPRTAFPPGPAPTTPVPPRETFPPGPAPTAPVPPREQFPPGPAPAYPPAQQWAYRSDLPPGPAPRTPVPPRPPEPPSSAAMPAPAAEKPPVAELAPDAPGKTRNKLGDPLGTTYHATPEDWAAWQRLQKLTPRERFQPENFQQQESLKNKYGGMPPAAPEAAAPAEVKLTAADLEPALLVGDKPVTGGESHEEIHKNALARGEDAEALFDALNDDTKHIFVDKQGNRYTRAEAAKALGEKEPLQSSRLKELKRPKPAEPAPAAEPTPPPAETPAATTAPTATTDPIGETIIEGKPLREWEKVTQPSDLPKGDARARLARRIGVNNQPQKILDRLKQPKKLREILAPPMAVEQVVPVAPPAPETPAPTPEPKPAEAETKPAQLLFVKFGNRMRQVSAKEASEMMDRIRGETGKGASELGQLVLYDAKGNPIGHVSYNGNVWYGTGDNLDLIHNATGLVKNAQGRWDLPTPPRWKELVDVQDKLQNFRDTHKSFSEASLAADYPEFAKLIKQRDEIIKQHGAGGGGTIDVTAETKPVAPETKTPVSETKPSETFRQALISKEAEEKEQSRIAREKSSYVPAIKLPTGEVVRSTSPQEGHGELDALYPEVKTQRGWVDKSSGEFLTTLEVARRESAKTTPAPAAKAQAEVSKVAATEGQRSAKEVKQELIDGLQQKLMEAPSKEEIDAAREGKPDGWPEGKPKTVTVDIPGDGVFTVPNTIENISEVLDRARKLKTDAGKPPGVPKAAVKSSAKILSRQPEPPTPPPEAAGPGSIGPGAAASAEFTARENRRRLLADFTERLFGSRAGEAVDAFLRKMAGEAVPKTMALSGESGNKMVRFAAANNAAPHMARSLTLEVLGDNFRNAEFRERLGAVLVEDRLRAIRKGLEDAAGREADLGKKQELLNQAHDVNSLVGPDKPFATEADFLNAIDDPEIAKAIEAHKQGPQLEAERFHTEADGQLAGPGVHTGAFVNLAPIFEDRPEMIFRGARKGDYTRPFKRKSVFSRTAKGTADKYELDYGTLAERMIRGNYEEFTKRQLYDQLVADNLAVIRPPGQPAPKFDGRPAEKFQIKRQTLITPNGAIPQYENLWVHPDVAPELRQAENLGSPVSSIALARVANVLNRIQLAGPTDAVWHIANMMSTIAGSQGGKTFLADLARKVPLVNVIDATVRVTQAAKKILSNDPDTMRQISDLAEIGQVRPERPGGGVTSRIINLLDKAGRVVRDDMYKNLVNRRLVEASEAGRREFVGQLGQYNPRLMGQIEGFFKEAGISPFIVAGRNFNRAALRRMSLSPSVRAANASAALQMRALEAVGVVGTLVAVPSIINLMTTGKPGGRDPSIPFGAIDTGKDDKNGKHIYIDPAQWIGLRRGMRMTGINAVVEGMRRGTPMRQIAKRAGQDIIGALVHPWAGPVVQLPFITATGYTTSGFKESKDPGDYWQNFKAALENINPVVHGWFQKQPGTGVAGGLESAGTSILNAFGVKTRAPATATSQVHDMAQTWASKSDDPKIRSEYEQHVKESFSSEYQDLRGALLRNDTAGARDAYQQLREKGKKPATIRQTLQHPHPFTGSARAEARFRQSLTPEQREVYNKAIEERRQLYHKFQQMLATPNQ